MRLIDADALGDITITINGTAFVRYDDIMNEPTIEIDQIVYDYLIKNNITEIQNHRTGLVFQLIRHGRWIEKKDFIYCSECGEGYDAIYKIDYRHCPNCGAIMEASDD